MEDHQLNVSYQNEEAIDQVRCLLCKDVPEQYISLDCKDDFCLVCLSQSYLDFINENKRKKIHQTNPNEIPCPICRSITLLDSESIAALVQTASEIVNSYNGRRPDIIFEDSAENYINDPEEREKIKVEPPSRKETIKHAAPPPSPPSPPPFITDSEELFIKKQDQYSKETIKRATPPSPPPYPNRNQNLYSSVSQIFCEAHKTDVAIYYCEDCQNSVFCQKCMPIHSNHSLINLSHDHLSLENRMRSIKSLLQRKLRENESILKNLETRRNIVISKMTENKQTLMLEFQELKRKIEEKEDELEKQGEDQVKHKLAEMDQYMTKIRGQTEEVREMEKKIGGWEGSPGKILREFGERKGRLMEKMEFAVEEVMEAVNGFRCNLDLRSFYSFLENINMLKLEIENFRLPTKEKSSKKQKENNLVLTNFSNNKTNTEILSTKSQTGPTNLNFAFSNENKIVKNKDFFSSFQDKYNFTNEDFYKTKKKSGLTDFFDNKKFKTKNELNTIKNQNLNSDYKLNISNWKNRLRSSNERKSRDFRPVANSGADLFMMNLEKQRQKFEKQREFFYERKLI